MDKTGTLMGPYRATRLWNDIITTFRSGMKVGRHRKAMKTYDDCFVASEAIDWMHNCLQTNPNFGPEVTRQQTIQLMQKFLKSKVFEDVRGAKHNKEQFEDNSRLYRFTQTSPLRPIRTPLRQRNGNSDHLAPSRHLDYDQLKKVTCIPEAGLPECKLVAKPLSTEEIENEYKNITLGGLRRILGVESLEGILDREEVSGKYIFHNMNFVNKNGIVTNIERKDQLPVWILSAMKCLAYWPNNKDDRLPDYPGFERDVFRVVQDYFIALEEPLLTFDMYDVFINVLSRAENMGKEKESSSTNSSKSTNKTGSRTSLNSFASVENLMLNLTNQGWGNMAAKNPFDNYARQSVSCLNLSRITPVPEQMLYRYDSTNSVTHSKYETEFSGEGNAAHTVYHEHPQTLSSDQGHGSSYNTTTSHSRSRQASAPSNLKRTSQQFASVHNLNQEDLDNNVRDVEPNLLTSHNKFYSTTHLNTAEQFLSQGGLQQHRDIMGSQNTASTFSMASTHYGGHSQGASTFGYSGGQVTSIYGSRLSRCPSGWDFRGSTATLDRPRSVRSRAYDENSESEPPRPRDPPSYKPPPAYNVVVFNREHQPVISGAALRRNISNNSNSGNGNSSSSTNYYSARSQQWSEYETARASPYDNRLESVDIAEEELSSGYNRLNSDVDRYNSDVDRYNSDVGRYNRDVGRTSFRNVNNNGTSVGRVNESRNESRPTGLFMTEEVVGCVQNALQTCCLFLPPARKRKLHLLLRLMSLTSHNRELVLTDTTTTRQLVLSTFSRCILRSKEEVDLDELLSMRLVGFMMDHYEDILSVPEHLKKQVDDRIIHLRRARVTLKEYESQRLGHSQRAVSELLENIIRDKTMGDKEKKKKLKQFKNSYPEIYSHRFPTSQSEADFFPAKPKIKQPLLSRPLQRLRSLRF
ncbi:DEP domain-containing protein 1B isoform X2 [Lingula anatina]|uniref:DEP domain-containing protein 1B isoform X2 n=1 Tax=Lingula anatina TaxID=7574 RepID=A0A1S3J407_LINAN|nr:DEP domain-containing protein 1B isoform X2 [Lingula anatina]|eukprot:XP_013405001.1 DEP domain-containing protein 1B isoform X2 [Lingula anatina]